MGWRVGDRIGVTTTSRGTAPVCQIISISPATEWRLVPTTATAGVEKLVWGEGAMNAIDGNPNTRWGSWCAPYCTGNEQWLQVNLQKPSLETRIRLRFDYSRYAPRYAVEALAVGSAAWSTAAKVTDGTGGWQDIVVAHNATALRITADFQSMATRGTEPAWAGLFLYEFEVFGKELDAAEQMVLYLDKPLDAEHWGGLRNIQGLNLEMAAEVVNLERSVVITGDHDDFEVTHQGLHTIMHGEGIMDIRYARVKYCGQRDFMGKYCMHFHHGGHCPDCVLQGNAIVEGSQVGITVHGTHRSLLDSNVLWDVQAAGIFTEDGNEIYNTISGSIIICSWWEKCSVRWLGEEGQVAGLYLIGMTNHFIENRIAGYENGIWTVGSIAQNGQGMALNRVCPQHTPFGTFRGNVNHDCQRFGLYLDNQYPRYLERDNDGFVTDMGSCAEFTAEGRDNGVVPANVIEDEFDWHNMFVGQYSMGDIAFVNLVSVNNAHAMYWKESKNFADKTARHVRDSIFVNDPLDLYGQLQFLGPAGPFTFSTDVSFVGGPVGCGALCADQHCGLLGAGGPCTVQYLLDSVDFSLVQKDVRRIAFGVNSVDMGYVQPVFVSSDNSLDGCRSMVSRHLNGFASVDGCEATENDVWDHAIA
mmetsp:Transcript_33320/g.59824  ORF Transcript_33320/g.59824 Transcript_33320/m.59824 type:complete len:643 (-) Transcript_33320:417-2345(-)